MESDGQVTKLTDEREHAKLTANFSDSFSNGYLPLNEFVDHLKLLQNELTEKNIYLQEIDFGRNGYITDAAIKILSNALANHKMFFSHVNKISMEGCSMLTDVGLHWLAQSLTLNKKTVDININGCARVTDGGLATLFNAPGERHIEAMCTSVAHLKDFASTIGCPLLIDQTGMQTKIQKTAFLLIVPVGTKWSLAEYIKSNAQKEREAIHDIQSIQLADWEINVTEIEKDHVLFESILPMNPVHVIIPFDAKSSMSELKEQVINIIAHILSKETPNPVHNIEVNKLESRYVFQKHTLYKGFIKKDGIFRPTSSNSPQNKKRLSPDIETDMGSVLFHKSLSRTNSYYEIQCTSSQENTWLMIGVLNDQQVHIRIPLISMKTNELAVDILKLEKDAIYGFGVSGNWISEYIPDDDCCYYVTKNGKLLNQEKAKPSVVNILKRNPQPGMYPFICTSGEIKLLNMDLHFVTDVNDNNAVLTPGLLHNLICNDAGIVRFGNYVHTVVRSGIMLCSQEITRNHNIFSICLKKNPKNICMGIAPETYCLYNYPNQEKFAIELNCGDGHAYIQDESGRNTASEVYHTKADIKEGKVITVQVKFSGQAESIQNGDEVEVSFFLDEILISTVKTKIEGIMPGIRIVFMVWMKIESEFQLKNWQAPFSAPVAHYDKLTMGRSEFLNIYDDGRLTFRESAMACHGLFISNTPFNKDLTYFEMQVTDSAAVIGFADFDYPVDNTLGNNPNSVGYFYNGRISKDLSSVNFDEDTTLTAFKAGDTVGCGLNVERAKFRENGLLENEQTLQFYFTKNNIKVLEVDFEYKSNGIYPAVNVYPGGNGVILHNYFKDSENKATKKVASTPPKDVANFIEGCRFTLVGLEENDGNLNEKLHLMEKTLSEGIHFPIIELITQYIHQYESELKSMDFQKQELYSNLCWQKECLERFLKNLRVTLKTVNLSSGKGHEELCKHIIDVCEADLTYHRQFYSLSEKVAEGLQKIREVLKKDNIMFIDQLLKAEPNAFGTNTHVCEAAVSYLKNKGQILCFTMNEAKVAVDREFLLQLEGKFKNLPSALSGKQAQCIGEKTNILNNLTDIIPNTKNLSFSQMETIIKVLSIIGIKRIPCLRSSRDDPVFCYCMQIDQQALQLSDFIQSAITNATELERKYHLLHTSAKHMFSICVSRFLTFSKAIVIGQEWCVFQNGDIQTIFYTKGDHVLKVKSHCFQPQNTDKLSQESMLEIQENTFTLFSIFVDVIDEIIKRMGISFVYKELIPSKLVNGSIGCIHRWELSEEHSRKTICTLCGNCCEKGLYCEFNGVKGDNLHKCCCETHVTGCKHCGVCKNCAEMTWAVESCLRPNLEVTSYEQMKAMPTTPLLLSAYDEVEFTNLGRSKAPLCLKMDIDINKQRQQKRRLIKIFPFKAFEYTYKNQLQNDVSYWHQSNQMDKTLAVNRGDTVVFKFEKILKCRKSTSEMENPITPAYFSCKNQFVAVCHEFGLLLHTAYPANSIYGRNTFGQFLSARPLTPKCPSFSIRIINLGSKSIIAIGLCNQNFSKIDLPGHTQDSFGYHADDGCIYLKEKQFSTRHECKTGDTMKCELDFKKKCIQFYHNGAMIYRTEELKDINNLHAIIAFGSYFEAVHLLEKEPWQIDGTEEQLDFPQAYDVKKYENIWFSPATTVGLSNRFDHYWLLIYNPTMKSIGFRMTPQLESSTVISCLGSLKHYAICVPVDKYLSKEIRTFEVQWFPIDMDEPVSMDDVEKIYFDTDPDSLMTHRWTLQKPTKSKSYDSKEQKELILATKDLTDGYTIEVVKNGSSLKKYWLKEATYTCHLPIQCDVLVRFPKFQTEHVSRFSRLVHPET